MGEHDGLSFMAAVRTTRAVLPQMIARGSGSIVNNASVNATLPDPLVIDYSAAKGALANFSKALSKEVGPARNPCQCRQPGPCLDGAVARSSKEWPLLSQPPRAPTRMMLHIRP